MQMFKSHNVFGSAITVPALVVLVLAAFCVANAQQPGRQPGLGQAVSQPATNEGTPTGPKATSQQSRTSDSAVPNENGAKAASPSDSAAAGSDAGATQPPEPTNGQPSAGSKAGALPKVACPRTVKANVVAIEKTFMLNRLGASLPDGLIFALSSDVDLTPGGPQLKSYKRARPLVLRVNEGDCLEITFTNLIPVPVPPATAPSSTPDVGIHVEGMQMVNSIDDGGTFVGVNNSALEAPGASPRKYTLYAEKPGTYLMYTLGDTSTTGAQLGQGLFGAVNVEPKGAEWYRSQVTAEDLALAVDKTKGMNGFTSLGQPIIKYDAKYTSGPRAGQPILQMTNGDTIVHSDLTAIITGPNHGRFYGINGPNKEDPDCSDQVVKVDPDFCRNPALPDRKQPFREITTIYHLIPTVVQAFPIFTQQPIADTIKVGADNFAINYGTGGIAAEIYANRIGVGPMGPCTDCKFEEFFLSSWAVGDPAMLVDKPANTICATNPAACQPPPSPAKPFTVTPISQATVAFFPDDPSNVYHSYVDDHVIFRILHGGTDVTHVHHQHAQQWLQSPNSDNASYLDSQMISPGASYTLEMVYNGSGNLNKTIGDSIFHCHFYPHFASGMWSMWRVHDVFEAGTPTCSGGQPSGCSGLPDGTPVPGSRALPDGEIANGTPIPALVPLPTIPMAIPPSRVFVQNNQVVFGTLTNPDPTGSKVTANPGYPFLIPGIAGKRAPHPPLDFAEENGQTLDGGLPRHVSTGGTLKNQVETTTDWSKDLATLKATELPEDGTHVEKVAISYFGKRCQDSFLSSGAAANCTPQKTGGFILNGLPRGPQHGAPFADPAMDIAGNPVGEKRIYKAAAFQLNVVFNKQYLWHYPQQRMLSLWEDVAPTIKYAFGNPNSGRQPEPLFMRANSQKDFVEYWHTNLVPNYYLRDDFQVRTPTDIIGQHIHLVKFDVTSSDGAANGFNYEDGTFSPDEVRELIDALNAPGGQWTPCTDGNCPPLRAAQPPPAEICSGPNPPAQCTGEWIGAQTTIQRWYVDPLLNDNGVDRTMRTVFTHDHFGPSTHQQAGLYAGLLTEPMDAKWRDPATGSIMGGAGVPPVRPDGGPTSWNVDILTGQSGADSYREFALEYQDFQLAYANGSPSQPNPDPSIGYSALSYAINPGNLTAQETPFLISGAGVAYTPASTPGTAGPGTLSLNYLSAPILPRVGSGQDLSNAFDSTYLNNGDPNSVHGDPITPLLRAYVNDKVQVRVLVGAHMLAHFFDIYGIKWFSEAGTPTDKKAINNSGFRASQGMGLSEHFEMLFTVPPSSITGSGGKCPDGYSPGEGACVDYLYSPSYDDTGLAQGIWGLFRSYDPTKPFGKLKPLPAASNPIGAGSTVPKYAPCPATAPKRDFKITAVTAQKAVQGGQLVYNSRGAGTPSAAEDPTTVLRDPNGILYVKSEDVDDNGNLKPGVPVEPLILRANAGDCIQVTLKNGLDPSSKVFSAANQSPIDGAVGVEINGQLVQPEFTPSKMVGLSPQLLSYDPATSEGVNVGYNKAQGPGFAANQTAAFGSSQPNNTVQYTWYAGEIAMDNTGKLVYTPVELGSLNLFAADTLLQHADGLFGSMIVEPKGATWKCDGASGPVPCDAPASGTFTYPTTRASATVSAPGAPTFREFVNLTSDDVRVYFGSGTTLTSGTTSAVNYRSEPTYYRYNNPGNPNLFAPPNGLGNNVCATSNLLVKTSSQTLLEADPQTPVFTATVGQPVRFRLMHPPGTGTSQVFTLSGHEWERNPYANFSTQIGDNWQSQWMGSHDTFGASDHFDMVIAGAGGKFRVPGDYLYTVFLPSQNSLGAWGIFRVLDAQGKAVVGNPSCPSTTGTAPAALPKSKDVGPFIRQPQPAPGNIKRIEPAGGIAKPGN
jgi:hypothetical protein